MNQYSRAPIQQMLLLNLYFCLLIIIQSQQNCMFRKFAERIRQGEGKFLVGLFGVVTITGLAYLAYRNFTRRQEKSHIQTPSQHPSQIHDPPLEQPQLNPANEQLTKSLIRVVNNVKTAAKNSQDFAYEAVKAIYEGYHELSFPQFKKLTLESRKIRRQKMENIHIYKEVLQRYEKLIDEARTNSLKAILEFFKLDLSEWLVLAEKYSQESKQQWDQVMIMTDVKQMSGLRSPETGPVHPQIIIQIYEYKDHIFDEVLHAAGELFPERNSGEMYNFIERRLSDLVFFKFGIEDEDSFFSMVVVSPSTKQKIEELQQRLNIRLEFFASNPQI